MPIAISAARQPGQVCEWQSPPPAPCPPRAIQTTGTQVNQLSRRRWTMNWRHADCAGHDNSFLSEHTPRVREYEPRGRRPVRGSHRTRCGPAFLLAVNAMRPSVRMCTVQYTILVCTHSGTAPGPLPWGGVEGTLNTDTLPTATVSSRVTRQQRPYWWGTRVSQPPDFPCNLPMKTVFAYPGTGFELRPSQLPATTIRPWVRDSAKERQPQTEHHAECCPTPMSVFGGDALVLLHTVRTRPGQCNQQGPL